MLIKIIGKAGSFDRVDFGLESKPIPLDSELGPFAQDQTSRARPVH